MPDLQQANALLESRGQVEHSAPWLPRITVVAACVALGACTTVGMQTRQRVTIDYGPPVQMRVCVLKAPGVTPQRVSDLVGAVNTEFAPYGIQVVVPWMRPWARSGFTYRQLFDEVAARELEPPCDRLMAFVDRNVGDFLWSLAMPEVLGAVDDDTHTHGFVIANWGSLNQLIASPKTTTVHEFYHLLGCPHAVSLSYCYGRIAALKRSLASTPDFFPGVGRDEQFLLSRNAVNDVMQIANGGELPRRSVVADSTPQPANP